MKNGLDNAFLNQLLIAESRKCDLLLSVKSVCIFIKVTYASNEFAIVQRIVPRSHVASGVGLYNGFTMMVGGGLGPAVVGGVVSTTGSYTAGPLSLGVLCLAGGIVMIILGWLIKY